MRNFTCFLLLLLAAAPCAMAQIPENAQKHFEYKETVEVRRAGAGDLYKRLSNWASNLEYESTTVLDDSNMRFVTVSSQLPLPESHFGVNRIHRKRLVEYKIVFDCDRKEYVYSLSDIRYIFEEEDHKGRVEGDSVMLEEFKNPARKSVEEEVDIQLRNVIASFVEASETALPEPEPAPEPAPEAAPSPEEGGENPEAEPTPEKGKEEEAAPAVESKEAPAPSDTEEPKPEQKQSDSK